MSRRAFFAIVLTATAFLVSAAQAGTRTDSAVTIHLPPGGSAAYFYGLVTSSRTECESHRALKILQRPTPTSGYQPYAAGIETNADGTWTFEPAGPYVVNGYYKAVALPKTIHNGVCTKAQSKSFFVD